MLETFHDPNLAFNKMNSKEIKDLVNIFPPDVSLLYNIIIRFDKSVGVYDCFDEFIKIISLNNNDKYWKNDLNDFASNKRRNISNHNDNSNNTISNLDPVIKCRFYISLSYLEKSGFIKLSNNGQLIQRIIFAWDMA